MRCFVSFLRCIIKTVEIGAAAYSLQIVPAPIFSNRSSHSHCIPFRSPMQTRRAYLYWYIYVTTNLPIFTSHVHSCISYGFGKLLVHFWWFSEQKACVHICVRIFSIIISPFRIFYWVWLGVVLLRLPCLPILNHSLDCICSNNPGLADTLRVIALKRMYHKPGNCGCRVPLH